MRIVHISTSATGGAGRSAFRLHEAMLLQQIDSTFLSIDHDITNGALKKWKQIQTPQPKTRKWYQFLKESSGFDNQKKQLKKFAPGLRCEAVSLPFSDYALHNLPEVQQADIINLHWVSGLLDYPAFFSASNKNVVWTLHDMQPFSGLFHYEEDAERNKEVAGLEKQIIEIKSGAVKDRKGLLEIVTPSHWLLEKSLKSVVFAGLKGSVIPYSLDLNIFNIKDKIACRTKLGLHENRNYLLFVSKHISVERKGWKLLHDAMNKLAFTFPNWTMIVIGQDENLPAALYDRVIAGNINNDENLAEWYAACDAVAIPSLEDNLPNVMLEAFACGRPVLSFDNGGMREHVLTGQTGWIGKRMDMLQLLQNCYTSSIHFEASEIRQYAVDRFNQQQQVRCYMDLYNRIVN